MKPLCRNCGRPGIDVGYGMPSGLRLYECPVCSQAPGWQEETPGDSA